MQTRLPLLIMSGWSIVAMMGSTLASQALATSSGMSYRSSENLVKVRARLKKSNGGYPPA